MKPILLAGLLTISHILLAHDSERAKNNLAHEAT